MSFESAKKLGFTASIIQIVMPIVVVAVLIAFYIALFSSIISSVSTGVTPAFSNTALSGILPFILIPLAAVVFTGYILFLIAMHRLSEYYNEKAIFKNVLNPLIIQIIYAAILIVVMVFASSALVGNIVSTTTTGATSTVWSFLGIYGVVFAVSFVVAIYCAFLYKRAFYKLAEKSGVDNFRTTGLLYLIGNALAIFGGSVIVWIAWIFAAMGFRKLAPISQATTQSSYYSPNEATSTTATKRCPTCGAENNPASLYCEHCGKPL